MAQKDIIDVSNVPFDFEFVDQRDVVNLRSGEGVTQDQFHEAVDAYEAAYNHCQRLTAMTVNLLDKLMSDPDKHYLYWPNRCEVLAPHKEKIKAAFDSLPQL